MEEQCIFIKELTEEIISAIKEDIVATYERNREVLRIRFLNGQSFSIRIEEL